MSYSLLTLAMFPMTLRLHKKTFFTFMSRLFRRIHMEVCLQTVTKTLFVVSAEAKMALFVSTEEQQFLFLQANKEKSRTTTLERKPSRRKERQTYFTRIAANANGGF